VVTRTRLSVAFIRTLAVLFLAATIRVNILALDSSEAFLNDLPMLFLLFSDDKKYGVCITWFQ
jgi:hypothetical protein